MWSPPLDALGNTVRGVSFSEKFIEKFNFHRFDNLTHLKSKEDPRKHRYDVDKESTISLLYSATTGDVTALRRFHGQGSNMHLFDYDKRTALHLAAAEGHIVCVKFLVEVCEVSPSVKDRWGFTPLVEALRFHHRIVAAFLIEVMKIQWPEDLKYSMKLVEKILKEDVTLAEEISRVKTDEAESDSRDK